MSEKRHEQSVPVGATAGLSIVVVNWNTRELLLELLEKLLVGERDDAAEDDPWARRDVEVVVVDNASSDGSVAAAQARFPQVAYVPQEHNLGFAGGVNRGLAAARHEFVLLLNTDVETSRRDIEELVRYLEDHPEAAIVGPRITNADGSVQSSCWRSPSLWGKFCATTWLYKLFPRSARWNPERYAGASFTEPRAVDCVSGCVFLTRRDLMTRVGGLHEGYFMYFEETDLCSSVRSLGYEVHHAPVGRFVHDGGGSGHRVREQLFLEFRRSELLYFKRQYGTFACALARGMSLIGATIRCVGWSLATVVGRRGAAARARANARAIAYLADPRSGSVPPSVFHPTS